MLQMSFAGTLGRDPETRAAGKSDVTEFSVAVNGYDFGKKEKTTTWLKVNIWGERGAKLGSMLAKGDKVAGSGQFAIESYTNREGVEKVTYKVTCSDITMMGGSKARDDDSRPGRAAQRAASKGKAAPPADFPDSDPEYEDDIPF